MNKEKQEKRLISNDYKLTIAEGLLKTYTETAEDRYEHLKPGICHRVWYFMLHCTFEKYVHFNQLTHVTYQTEYFDDFMDDLFKVVSSKMFYYKPKRSKDSFWWHQENKEARIIAIKLFIDELKQRIKAQTKITKVMKTVLVIYTNKKLTSKAEIGRNKRYAFNTKDQLSVGDMIESSSYNTKMQVVKVLDECYKYYNGTTGKLSQKFSSTNQWEIRNLAIREDEDDTIYAKKLDGDSLQ